MQGQSRMDRELLDAGEMAGHLVPASSVFAFVAEHRRELFPDSFTADLFRSRTGRPSLPADLVGSVLVLKELHDLSDAQAAEALAFDIRWKVACGRSLTQMSFDPSTLVYWRKRIAASDRPDRGLRCGGGGDRADRDLVRPRRHTWIDRDLPGTRYARALGLGSARVLHDQTRHRW